MHLQMSTFFLSTILMWAIVSRSKICIHRNNMCRKMVLRRLNLYKKLSKPTFLSDTIFIQKRNVIYSFLDGTFFYQEIHCFLQLFDWDPYFNPILEEIQSPQLVSTHNVHHRNKTCTPSNKMCIPGNKICIVGNITYISGNNMCIMGKNTCTPRNNTYIARTRCVL